MGSEFVPGQCNYPPLEDCGSGPGGWKLVAFIAAVVFLLWLCREIIDCFIYRKDQ